jgi:hypothetical protein
MAAAAGADVAAAAGTALSGAGRAGQLAAAAAW